MEKNIESFKAPIQKMVEDTQKDSTIGPIIGSTIIILVIVVGGLYFLGSLIAHKKALIQTEQMQAEQAKTTQVEETAKQSNSDEVPAIEADIQSTNVDSIDASVKNLDKEF